MACLCEKGLIIHMAAIINNCAVLNYFENAMATPCHGTGGCLSFETASKTWHSAGRWNCWMAIEIFRQPLAPALTLLTSLTPSFTITPILDYSSSALLPSILAQFHDPQSATRMQAFAAICLNNRPPWGWGGCAEPHGMKVGSSFVADKDRFGIIHHNRKSDTWINSYVKKHGKKYGGLFQKARHTFAMPCFFQFPSKKNIISNPSGINMAPMDVRVLGLSKRHK